LLSEARFSELKIKPGSIRSHQWFVAPAALLHEVAGFKFHGGMMGLGRRPPRSEVEDLLLQSKSSGRGIVITAGVKSQDNLGLIIRTAKALGWAGVVTTPDAGDPWSRRVLRQSMGASAFIPVVQSPYLGQTLTAIRHHKMTLVGAALTDSALSPEGVATVIGTGTAPRIALLLGNEHEGLTPALIEACDHLVRIPMIPGHDSLNVAVAAGILLWHWSPLRHSELDHQIVDTFQGHS
jgi:tRNA G18 (ribose-2'-O)-methylase SpoU